jgi:hypothetical protein
MTVNVRDHNLSPAPRWSVGDRARVGAGGRDVKIDAGPFKGMSGRRFYVVTYMSADWQERVWEDRLTEAPSTQAQPAEDPDTYVFRGRTYDLRGEYADRQGDVWKFNGRRASDGTPLMDCVLYPSFSDSSLSWVLACYGPLSRA